MKKFSRLFFIALYLILCFSCSLDQEKPESGTQETISIVVPKSFGPSINSRGLVDMVSKEHFNNNFGCATAVMSLVPAVANLELKNDAIVGESNDFLIKDEIDFYGFTIKPQVKGSIVNQDGVYIRYDLPAEYDDDQVVGTIEYYYSTIEKTFSYREMVFLTIPLDSESIPVLSPQYPYDYTNWKNFLIIIEYKDIPIEIEDDGSISFKAGLPVNGDIAKDLHFDAIHFSPIGIGFPNNFAISRYWGTINKTKDLYLAFGAPFTGQIYSQKDIPSDLSSSVSGKKFNEISMDEVYDIISEIYINGNELKKHDLNYSNSYTGPYSSLAQFNASLLWNLKSSYKLKPFDQDEYKTVLIGMGPTCFNIETQQSITLLDPTGSYNTVSYRNIEVQQAWVIQKYEELLGIELPKYENSNLIDSIAFGNLFFEKIGIVDEKERKSLINKIY